MYTAAEYGVTIIYLIIGAIGSAVIIGDILAIIATLDSRSNLHKERMSAVNQLLACVAHLPLYFRFRVLGFKAG